MIDLMVELVRLTEIKEFWYPTTYHKELKISKTNL